MKFIIPVIIVALCTVVCTVHLDFCITMVILVATLILASAWDAVRHGGNVSLRVPGCADCTLAPRPPCGTHRRRPAPAHPAGRDMRPGEAHAGTLAALEVFLADPHSLADAAAAAAEQAARRP